MTVEAYPLAVNQARMWSAVDEPRACPLIATCTIRISGELERERLRAALERVVARYEILRTRIAPVHHLANAVAQVVISPEDATIELAAADGDVAGGSPVINLLDDLPFRATLVSKGRAEHALTIRLPSFCADDMTLFYLAELIAKEYAGAQGHHGDEPVQYSAVCEWLNEIRTSAEAEEGRRYWREVEARRQVHMRLPIRRLEQRQAQPREQRAVVRGWSDRASALERLARDLEVSAEAVLLAGWARLLTMFAGTRALTLGVLFDGRSHEELHGVLGPLAATLPVDVNLEGAELDVAGLVRAVERHLVDARDWLECYAPDELERDGEAQAEDGFWAGFAMLPPRPVRETGGVRWALLEHEVSSAKSDLELRCTIEGGHVEVVLAFDARHYDAAEVALLGRAYCSLLDSLVEDPARPIDRVTPLTRASWEALRVELAGPRRAVAEENVWQAIRRQAVAEPDRTAIRCGDVHLSYGALVTQVQQIAAGLRSRGVGAGDVVGVCAPRSVEFLVGILAVQAAGAAYLPLDASLPGRRLNECVAEARARLVIVKDDSGPQIETAPVLTLSAAQQDASSRLLPDAHGGLAYVISTSGTTGRPKSAAIYHRGLANLLAWYVDALELGPEDRVLVFSSVGFDMTQKNLLAPLMVGAQVHLFADEFDPREIAAAVARDQITLLNCASSAFNLVLDAAGDSHFAHLSSLRALILGGDELEPSRLARWQDAPPVFNGYGPTECADITTCSKTVTIAALADRRVPIGRPIPNVHAYVLDERAQPVPHGAIGELCIGGRGIGVGYMNAPRSTAARFLPDLHGEAPGARMYASGDLVRLDAQGELVFVGRVDDQVKVAGVRIELGDVEAAMRMHPKVTAVACKSWKQGDVSLIAGYFVVDEVGSLGEAELREFLGNILPAPMIPARLIVLDSLPLSRHGKLDRSALPDPEGSSAPASSHAQPRDQLETALCHIWCELLELPQVGPGDDFFELGGHSLVATRIVSKLNSVFQVRIALRDLFEARTIEHVAHVLRERASDADALEEIADCYNEVARLTGEQVAVELEAMEESERRSQ